MCVRLNLILPKVEPNEFGFLKQCPRIGCPGRWFAPRQKVSKKVVDAQYQEVAAWRCECQKCHYGFRVYPRGVLQKQISKRVNSLAVMLYILGLSYGAVEIVIVLSSLGMMIGKTSMFRPVQSVAQHIPGLKRDKLLAGYQPQVVGADVASVCCNGQWVTVGVAVDSIGIPPEQALADLASLSEMIH